MQRTYPHGVPCWIDTEVSDPEAAQQFYGGLFGWTFENAMPPGAPGFYLIAKLDGADVAAIGPATSDGPSTWNTYVAVDDADTSAAAVTSAGGTIVEPPMDAGPGGRSATVTDPLGARFRLWQARRRLGAQVANVPGSWNFSDVRTTDFDAALAFYGTVFGWVAAGFPGDGEGSIVRVPGYGDHLQATVDPGIRERQAGAPEGFADAIGAIEVVGPTQTPHWHVKLSVADRDATADTAEKLGATVLSTETGTWSLSALLRDPQGAEFTISQFTPPS